MPNPIEPSPITAMSGFVDSGMRRPLSVSCGRNFATLPLGNTAWPRCQSVRQGRNRMAAMSETKIREEICRLGRSLFERGLTPGSSGNISVKLDDGGWLVTPTNASLGFLDPAKLSRLGADGRLVSGDAPTKEVPLHTALYQTRNAARAVVHLHSTHSVALSMLPEIDPARRAAADDAVLPDEVRRDRAGALLSARRSRGGRRDQGTGRQIFLGAVRQSRAGRVGRYAGGRGVRDGGTGGDGEIVSAAARAEPEIFVAGAGGGSGEGVRVDVAGAWA